MLFKISSKWLMLLILIFLMVFVQAKQKFSAIRALRNIDIRAGKVVTLGTGIHRELRESSANVVELQGKVEQLSRREDLLVEKLRQLKAKAVKQEEDMKSIYNDLMKDAEEIVRKVREQAEKEKKALQEELLARAAAEREQLYTSLNTKFEAEKVALREELTLEKEKEVAAVRAEIMKTVESQAAEIRELMNDARDSMRKDVARDFEQTRREFDLEIQAMEEKEAAKINLLLVLFANRLEKMEASMEAKLSRAREKLRLEQIRSKHLEKILEKQGSAEHEALDVDAEVSKEDDDQDKTSETSVMPKKIQDSSISEGPTAATVPTFKSNI